MQLPRPTSWRAGLAWLGAALLALVLAVLLLAWSGLYSVAASTGHMAWVSWLLELGMRRSVSSWSLGVADAPLDLDSPARVTIGAAHFYGGCANCHGAPGDDINAVHDRMLPPPPKLAGEIYDWRPEQLFWIVRHGIKYTGMPYWSGDGRDDEVWSVVAFLRQMPNLSPEEYEELVSGNTVISDTPAEAIAAGGDASMQLTACDRCHDTATAAPPSDRVPRLGGQSAAYLARVLREYRDDSRQSGIMEPVATELSDAEIERLSHYYAALASPKHKAAARPVQARIDRGEVLHRSGDADNKIPACSACHGPDALAIYPRLVAQPGTYTRSQLELWQRGGRAETSTGTMMAAIARRLNAEQIEDLAAYYQSLPAPRHPQGRP